MSDSTGTLDLAERARRLSFKLGRNAIHELNHASNPTSHPAPDPHSTALPPAGVGASPRGGLPVTLPHIVEEGPSDNEDAEMDEGKEGCKTPKAGLEGGEFEEEVTPTSSVCGDDELSDFSGGSSWSSSGAEGIPSPGSPFMSDGIRSLSMISGKSNELNPVAAALRAGASELYVNVWLSNNDDLLVGPTRSSLSPHKTLSGWYLEPLLELLSPDEESSFPRSRLPTAPSEFPQLTPHTPLHLFLTLQVDPPTTFQYLLLALSTLDDASLLTVYHPTLDIFSHSLIKVIITYSTAPIDQIEICSPRYIFGEVTFSELEKEEEEGVGHKWKKEVTPIAAGGLKDSVGWDGQTPEEPGEEVMQRLERQVALAHGRGMKARYSDLPKWPARAKENVHRLLLEHGVDFL